MGNRWVGLVILALLSAPLGALAQGRPIGLSDRKGGRDHAIELELDFNSISEDGPADAQATTLLPKIYGSFGLSRDLELEVTLPAVFHDYSADAEEVESDSTLLMGNPYVALFYADRSARSVARIGFGVALPVLDADEWIDGSAVMSALAARGLMDMWLYMPDTLALAVPGQVQMQASMFVLGVDGALALLIPTGDNDEEADAELALQVGTLFGLALGDATIGARLQLASVVTNDDFDATQLSFMPFVQADLDGGAFIHGGLLLNLDAPYGMFDDGDPDVWALRVGGGGRF